MRPRLTLAKTAILLLSLTVIHLIRYQSAFQSILRDLYISFDDFPTSYSNTLNASRTQGELLADFDYDSTFPSPLIPRTIHFIYFADLYHRHDGTSSLPATSRSHAPELCRKFNPSFDIRIWNETEAHTFIETEYSWFIQTYDAYKHPIQRVDALKYFALYHYGGWGQYLSKYVTAPVVNKAMAGRSARSYSAEGRFTEIANLVTSGDIVVIEFGHNDGGSPTAASDNKRSDCPGSGTETCKSGLDGSTVYTYNHYIEAGARALIAKGAKVVISSQTPNNLWEGGEYAAPAPRFVAYAAQAAKNVGAGASFVDHFQAVADMYEKLGSQATNALYPKDHTHTSPAGADLSAQAFAEAVKVALNGTTPLSSHLKPNIPTVW
ncbi:hypothetical protein E8E12_001479 [Didymella heteroderae]|uniref:Hydrolase n=1 Tax=Didymella heteroderae TaxID=1769908 RepID=A0A9P5BZ15_9PLEO|nr:hypothetical protein E8E12_001479 [Didymella heteroderae]